LLIGLYQSHGKKALSAISEIFQIR